MKVGEPESKVAVPAMLYSDVEGNPRNIAVVFIAVVKTTVWSN